MIPAKNYQISEAIDIFLNPVLNGLKLWVDQ